MKLRIFDTLRRTARWIVRFRKRKGYGVHSPFAFGLITGVVYEKGIYYAYSNIDKTYRENVHSSKTWRLKDYKLLFRLANFQHPKRGWIVGPNAHNLLEKVLSLGCQSCIYETTRDEDASSCGQYDLIIATEGWENRNKKWLHYLHEGGMLIVKGVGRKQRAAWLQLLGQPEAQVAFNLYDFGIVFFHPNLQRQHYVVNYW